MKVAAFVPIKLNSQRVKNKNIRKLGDKPLVSYVLNNLNQIQSIDDIYVYCSDEVIKSHLSGRAKFLKRNPALDQEEVIGDQIYGSFISKIEADIYILAHATSPFIKPKSIEAALDKVLFSGFDSAHAVTQQNNFAWFNEAPVNFDLNCMPRTQDIEPVYMETSAFFIFTKFVWEKHQRRFGNKTYRAVVSNIEGIDIDEEQDFLLAEAIVNSGLSNGNL
jgi:CMP-N-acetylneuraminic acid synthetase